MDLLFKLDPINTYWNDKVVLAMLLNNKNCMRNEAHGIQKSLSWELKLITPNETSRKVIKILTAI